MTNLESALLTLLAISLIGLVLTVWVAEQRRKHAEEWQERALQPFVRVGGYADSHQIANPSQRGSNGQETA